MVYSAVHYFVRMVQTGDVCSLLFLIAVFSYVGHFVVATEPELRLWGLRMAAAAFVMYVVYGAIQLGTPDANALTGVVLRALAVGGLMLGVSWILLPALAFLKRQCTRATKSAKWKAEQRRRKRNEKRRQREAERQRKRAQKEWERSAPERERAARQAEERRRRDREQQQAREQAAQRAKRHRDDAKFACQLLYDRLTPEQRQQFRREDFDAYFESFLTNSHTPDEIQERSNQLQAMIRDCFDPLGDKSKRFSDIKEIADTFQHRREEIESLGYDPRMKEALLMLIAKEEQTAIRELLSP